MATVNYAASPAHMLDTAAESLAAGEFQAGAGLIYEAASKAIKQAAARQGIPCDSEQDIQGFLHRMEGIPPVLDDWDAAQCFKHYRKHLNGRTTKYLSGFVVARSYKEHAETPLAYQKQDPVRYWPPDQYGAFIGPVRRLVELLETSEVAEDAK